MTESREVFTNLISNWDVEKAVISTLQVWLNEYLFQIEQKNNLRPKTLPRFTAPESIHGGVNFDTWRADLLPEAIIVVKPLGVELNASAGYSGHYSVVVGCLWIGSGSELAEIPEDETRAVASYLGAATMLLVQQPTLGGLAERLRMVELPEVTLPDPEKTRIAQVTTGFEVWVSTVVEESAGPVEPLPSESPQWKGKEEPYGELPVADEVEVTVVAEPITVKVESEKP